MASNRIVRFLWNVGTTVCDVITQHQILPVSGQTLQPSDWLEKRFVLGPRSFKSALRFLSRSEARVREVQKLLANDFKILFQFYIEFR